MFSLAYVILPVDGRAPVEAIRESLAPFERGMRGTLPEGMLEFEDETTALRELHETYFVFREAASGAMQIEGTNNIFHLDTEEVRSEMRRRSLRLWSVRFVDEMDLEAFVDRFGKQAERHPDTGAFGRWLNPIGHWDWWDLGGRFDGRIIGDDQVRDGRSVTEVSSGPSPGRAILSRLGDVLADALGQDRLPALDVRNDRNIEMVATLLDDARTARGNAFPATLVLPPDTRPESLRWLGSWPATGPIDTVLWLGLARDASWSEIVRAAYTRFADHWAAAVAYHH